MSTDNNHARKASYRLHKLFSAIMLPPQQTPWQATWSCKFSLFRENNCKELFPQIAIPTKFNCRVLCQQEKRTRRKDNSSFAQHILSCRWLEQRYCVRFYACFTFYFNCGKIFQHIVIEPFKRQRQRIFLCKSLYVVKSLSTKKTP